MISRKCLPCLALALCASSPRLATAAHNGAVAIAFPVEDIAVDGDLADWPSGLPWHALENFLGASPDSEEDLRGRLRVGFGEQPARLLVALEVVDDAHVFDAAATGDIEAWDSCYLYLDREHVFVGSRPEWFAVGGTPAGEGLRKAASSGSTWDGVHVAVRRVDSRTVYEWSLPLGADFAGGTTVGFDVVLCDLDVRGADLKYACWGPSGAKADVAGRLGDIAVVDATSFPGTLTGAVQWEPARTSLATALRIVSLQEPALWFQVDTNLIGHYRVDVPAGDYRVAPAYVVDDPFLDVAPSDPRRITAGSSVEVAVEPVATATADRLVLETQTPLAPSGGLLHRWDGSQAEVIGEFVRAQMDYYGVPGISLAIVKDGARVYHRTFGVQSTLTQEPVDDSTLFEAASITKPVFAYAVMRLVERGVLDLDAPLHAYLSFPNIAADERSRAITARLVLAHRSGLPNWAWGGPGGWKGGGELALSFTPGERFGYSGEGFNYLGRVVEKLTGTRLEALLQEEAIAPTGMVRSCFSRNEEMEAVSARGHFAHHVSFVRPPLDPSPASSLHTEAADLARFMIALHEGRGMRPETMAEMLRPQTEVPAEERVHADGWDQSVSLGFFVSDTPFGRLVEHGGNNGDFRCKFGLFIDSGDGYAIFTNSNLGEKIVRAVELHLIGSGDD